MGSRLRKAGRRTNVALLVLLALALVTGFIGFGTGTATPARIVAVLHGVIGLALLMLVPWKQAIVRRGVGRRVARPGRWSGVALGILVVVSVAAGIAHASLGPGAVLGNTALQVHVGAALLAIPFLLHHVVVRPQRPRRADLSRRTALGALGIGVAAGTLYALGEGAVAAAGLPGGGRRGTGSYETGTGDPDAMPVTQWIGDPVPDVAPDTWHLVVRDATGTRNVPYADLAAGTDTVRAVLDCTGGWYAAQTWRGVRLDRLLSTRPSAGTRPAASTRPATGSVDVVSVTGYRRRLPASQARYLLLATHAGGIPLSAGHGAPVRLVAPGRRGFWWVKWVARIELVDEPWWSQPPFPTQ